MNLWVIDEKLAYHYYLASDNRLDEMQQVLASSDQTRPDLLIFSLAAAFADSDYPYSSVVVIEFKRPGRAGYKEDENPIDQVYDYIRQIKAGAVDRHGRP